GQPVDLVIHDDVSHVEVTTNRVNEMAHTNAVAITIATGGNHGHIAVAEFGALRYSDRAPMQRVHAVGVKETGDVGGTADSGDQHHFVRVEVQLRAGLLQAVEHTEVPTSGAPIGFYFRFKYRDINHVQSP